MNPRVFIGSSVQAVRIAEFAQRDLMHCSHPDVWTNDRFHSQKTPIEDLFRMLDEYRFALFVALPEDMTNKGGTAYHTVRDNVLFELGLFLGRLGRDRVFLIAPRMADGQRLHLPSDLTGIQPLHYDAQAINLQSTVSTSLLEMKEAIRSFAASSVIFSAQGNLGSEHLINKGGKRHDQAGNPVSNEGQANHKFIGDCLEITRTNSEGIWEIEVRPKGKMHPTAPRIPSTDRVFEVSFEARVTGAEHIVRCVSINANNWSWVDSKPFQIVGTTWKEYKTPLRAPINLDILIRLQDEIEQDPDGTLCLRNIIVKHIRA